jgi:hypothetical protein
MTFIRFCTLFAAITLAACSLKLQVALYNNTGETVKIRAMDESVSIETMQSRQVDYPGEKQGWTLQISTDHCDYTYAVPRTLEHYPWPGDSKNIVKVQIERDLTLYLLPPSSTNPVPIVGLASLQQDGFPLQPASKSCH